MLHQMNVSIREMDYVCVILNQVFKQRITKNTKKKLLTQPGINFDLECSNAISISKNNK